MVKLLLTSLHLLSDFWSLTCRADRSWILLKILWLRRCSWFRSAPLRLSVCVYSMVPSRLWLTEATLRYWTQLGSCRVRLNRKPHPMQVSLYLLRILVVLKIWWLPTHVIRIALHALNLWHTKWFLLIGWGTLLFRFFFDLLIHDPRTFSHHQVESSFWENKAILSPNIHAIVIFNILKSLVLINLDLEFIMLPKWLFLRLIHFIVNNLISGDLEFSITFFNVFIRNILEAIEPFGMLILVL